MSSVVTVTPTSSNAWAVISFNEHNPRIFATRSEAIRYAHTQILHQRCGTIRLMQSLELEYETARVASHATRS